MKVLAWNIRHGGGKRVASLAAAIAAHEPDIIVLSEFRADAGARLAALLRDAGFPHLIAPALAPRQNGVAIASRWVLVPSTLAAPSAVPNTRWIEVDVPATAVTVAAFYGPLETEAYHAWWDSVRDAVALRTDRMFLLAGDFNTGMSVVDAPRDPFYCSEHFIALQQLGMTDAWRSRNADAREYSWYSRRAGKDLNGFRLDHILTSPSLSARIATAHYSHAERLGGISDHAILLVDFHDGDLGDYVRANPCDKK